MKNIVQNTTFVISGHNIKWFGVLAAESLLDSCDVRREQVVYFDDNSTDGTAEEMHRRGIRVISWEKDVYDKFVQSSLRFDLPVRVSQIIASAIKTIDTKYLCFLDGDTFHTDDTVGKMLEHIEKFDEGLREDFALFGVERSMGVDFGDLGINLYQSYLWLNLEMLKENGIFGEEIEEIEALAEKYGEDDYCTYYDTGNCLYYSVKNKGLPMILIEFESLEMDELMPYHVGHLSSTMRDDTFFCGDSEEFKQLAITFLGFQTVIEMCEKAGIDVELMEDEYRKLFRKSPLCEE